MIVDRTLAYARKMDQEDGLARFRNEFNIPKNAEGKEEIYFCGNSLGLLPKRTIGYVYEFLNDWAAMGVRGHFGGSHRWLPYHELLTAGLASLAGAGNPMKSWP